MKIAVYGREFQPSVISYVQHLFDSLTAKGAELWIYGECQDFLTQQEVACPQGLKTYDGKDGLPKAIGFMLSLGGDGTMLVVVSIVGASGITVAGINFGRLGFLADIGKFDIDAAMEAILLGD